MSDTPLRDFHLLRDPEQIRSLGNKDRLQLIRALGEASHTGADLARELGLPANVVHYHLQQLLKMGLVEEVRRERKRWNAERFYRRSAKHFIVDPAISGGSGSVGRTVLSSIEDAFLDWRREELLHVDLGRVSRRIVDECLCLQPGQQVLLMHGPQGLDLAERLHVDLAAAGCIVHTRLWSHETIRATLDRFTAEELGQLGFLPAAQNDHLEAVIFLSATAASPPELSPDQRTKVPALMQVVSRWQKSIHERRIPYLEFALPFRREFDLRGDGPIRGVTPEEAVSIFWRCIETDGTRLAASAERLKNALDPTGWLQLRCPLGTDLRIQVDMASRFLLDGQLSTQDLEAGRTFEGLPAGTLNFFPVPGSANGRFRADYTYQGGTHVESVILEIEAGRIKDLKAERNEEILKARLAAAAGDANLVSGLRFGLNPAGRGPTGKPILDTCLLGAVTLHFGNNELQGGDVRSTMDLILPACHLSVESGGRRIIEDGHLDNAIRGIA
jgi:leucyl aminopeptidase (aminopeptidase T)